MHHHVGVNELSGIEFRVTQRNPKTKTKTSKKQLQNKNLKERTRSLEASGRKAGISFPPGLVSLSCVIIR